MKRIISFALSICLFACGMPVGAIAESFYVYPEIDAYILPNDDALLEREFRLWACQVIAEYYLLHAFEDSRNFDNLTGIEYQRLAHTKLSFDRSQEGNIKENIYNSTNMTDSDWDGLYLWVFLESLKEAVYVNGSDIIAQYDELSGMQRQTWMLDIETGDLSSDNIARQAQHATAFVTATQFADAANHVVAVAGETAADFFLIKNAKNDNWSDLVSLVVKNYLSASEQYQRVFRENLLSEVRNRVRDILRTKLKDAVYDVNDQMLEYLIETYESSDNQYFNNILAGNERYRPMILEFINRARSNKTGFSTALDAEVKSTVTDEDVEAILDSLEYVIEETLGFDTLVEVVFLSCTKTTLDEVIDFGCKKLTENMKAETITYTNGEIHLSMKLNPADIIDALKETLKSAVDDVIDGLIEDIYNGKSVSLSTVGVMLTEEGFTDKYREKFLAKFKAKLIGTGFSEEYVASIGDESIGEAAAACIKSVVERGSEDILNKDEMDGKDLSKSLKAVTKMIGKLFNSQAGSLRSPLNDVTEEINKAVAAEFTDQSKLAQLKKECERYNEKIQEYTNGNAVCKVLVKVWDTCWDAGGSIRTALGSLASMISGEGILSLLAMRMKTAMDMSNSVGRNLVDPIYTRLLGGYGSVRGSMEVEEYIQLTALDPEKISLEELYEIVSMIYVREKYDIVGASSYFNAVIHFDDFYGFSKKWYEGNDMHYVYNKLLVANFAAYVEDNHINVDRNQGFLSFYRANEEYNRYNDFVAQNYGEYDGEIEVWKTLIH